MTWARDWNKQWYTVDPGTVLVSRTGGYDYGIYTPVLWAIKDRLVAPGLGAWTVLASSGKAGGASLVANTDDNWLSPDDLVSGLTDASDRSWILLKSPTTSKAGTFYLLIDYWYNNATYHEMYCNFYFSKNQPDISSPAINARPSATGDEWSHTGTYIVRAVDGGSRVVSLSAVRANDGSFVFGISAPLYEAHSFNAIYMLNVLRNPKPWDPAKAVSLVSVNNSVQLAYNSTFQFKSLHSTGADVTVEPVWFRAGGKNPMSPNLTDPLTDKWVTWPIPTVCTTGGAQAFRGELEDIFWLGYPSGDGTLLFANEVVKAIRMGPFSVPFDQVGGIP